MDLRTFLPLPKLVISPPPAIGGPAPARPELKLDEPALVVFLRHPGCPFAEATLRELRRVGDAGAPLRLVAVTHGPVPAAERWLDAAGGLPEAQVIVDEDRTLSAAWGVGQTSLFHFAGLRSLWGLALLALRGIRNRHPSGTRWQGAAAYAVDAGGVVRFRHLPKHAADLPDLAKAAAALSG